MMPEEVGGTRLFRYAGRSMWPCFQEGDLLVVHRLPVGELRRGDCIVYRRPGEEADTVHRIVTLRPALWTRGDAWSERDDEPVTPESILGRVQERVRFGVSKPVAGGRAGRWLRLFYRYAGRLDPAREAKGGRLARLARNGSSCLLAFLSMRPHVVSYRTGKGDGLYYLVFGKRIVGKWNERERRYDLAWPYTLLLGPKLLPLSGVFVNGKEGFHPG